MSKSPNELFEVFKEQLSLTGASYIASLTVGDDEGGVVTQLASDQHILEAELLYVDRVGDNGQIRVLQASRGTFTDNPDDVIHTVAGMHSVDLDDQKFSEAVRELFDQTTISLRSLNKGNIK